MTSTGIYVWRIDDWAKHSTVHGSKAGQPLKLFSERFEIGDRAWRVLVYPQGNRNKHLAVYLDAPDAHTQASYSCMAKFSIKIVNQEDSLRVSHESLDTFQHDAPDWGFTSLMTLTKLRDPKNGFVAPDGSITVQASVTVLKVMPAQPGVAMDPPAGPPAPAQPGMGQPAGAPAQPGVAMDPPAGPPASAQPAMVMDESAGAPTQPAVLHESSVTKPAALSTGHRTMLEDVITAVERVFAGQPALLSHALVHAFNHCHALSAAERDVLLTSGSAFLLAAALRNGVDEPALRGILRAMLPQLDDALKASSGSKRPRQ